MDPDCGPQQLQNKVQFDIRYYMLRRGAENVDKMTKSSFKLQYDEDTQISYILKAEDEMTKNHTETTSEIITGFIPSIMDPSTGQCHRLCPVRSYTNYIGTLNPDCDRLWQTPMKTSANDSSVRYTKQPIGHNTLDKFMKKMSEKCDLSQKYTNHCIRVTGATNLTRANYSAKQIMSISGHKSLESLAIYQKVANDEKMMMGMSLMFSLFRPEEVAKFVPAEVTPKNPPMAIAMAPPTATVSTPYQVKVAVPADNSNTERAKSPTEASTSTTRPSTLETDMTLVPFNPTENTENEPSFDLAKLIQQFQDEEDDDNMLVKATQEAESENATGIMHTKSTTSAVIRRQPHPPQVPSFNNCKIANININIYKA